MIVKVRIKSNKKEFKIRRNSDVWDIELRSKPNQGKANAELLRELKRLYGNAKILRGFKSRDKIILVG